MNAAGQDYECTGRAGDVAAYALGALERDEAAAFAQHASRCIVCRDELEEYGQVVDFLAIAPVQLPPPRGLRRSVLAEVRSTPGARPGARARVPRRRWGLITALAAGVAAVALAIVLVSAPGPAGVRTIRAEVFGSGPAATAQLRLSAGHGVLVVRHLPPPARGDIYEVWVKTPHGKPQPTTALFGVTSRGNGVVAVPGNLQGVAVVMVTQEPAGGSRTPTGRSVVLARLD